MQYSVEVNDYIAMYETMAFDIVLSYKPRKGSDTHRRGMKETPTDLVP